MPIAIERLTMEMYDEVVALWRESEGVGLSDADSREKIRSYLERNPDMSFVARDPGGKIAGAILCGHDGRRGYIYHLAVSRHCRRQGIGRQLVERCLDNLRIAGIQKCHIFVLDGNADGIEFWKSMGWTPRSDVRIISKTIE
jgi:putative acetyltransferase